jgi:hypothetical protein
MSLTPEQKGQLDAAMQQFSVATASLQSQAEAFRRSSDHHMQSCGKHFENAAKELHKGMEELEKAIGT